MKNKIIHHCDQSSSSVYLHVRFPEFRWRRTERSRRDTRWRRERRRTGVLSIADRWMIDENFQRRRWRLRIRIDAGRDWCLSRSPLIGMMHRSTTGPHLSTTSGQAVALFGNDVWLWMNQLPHLFRTLPIPGLVLVERIVHRTFQISDVIHRHLQDLRLFQLLVSSTLEEHGMFRRRSPSKASYLIGKSHQIFQFVETFVDPIATFLFDTSLRELEHRRLKTCKRWTTNEGTYLSWRLIWWIGIVTRQHHNSVQRSEKVFGKNQLRVYVYIYFEMSPVAAHV